MIDTRRRYFTITFLGLLLFHIPLLVNCQCKKNPVIFNFGDSNSDTGGHAYGLGLNYDLPNGRTFFHRPSGRVSDGRLVIDFLCESLKTSYLTPYLEPLGPNFTNGANFAISVSTALPKHCPVGYLEAQVLQFIRFKNRSLELISQGRKDLVDEKGYQNALYAFDIGQNDIAGAFDLKLSYEQVIQTIPMFITQIKNYRLAVSNESDFDEHGCIKSVNDAAKEFNKKLSDLSEELRSQMKEATIVYTDIYTIKYELIANSKQYGFENPLMACCGYGGPPYNFNTSVGCGKGSNFNVCNEGSKYISWDGVHYTEAANAIAASKILSADYSLPKLNFNYFCQN